MKRAYLLNKKINNLSTCVKKSATKKNLLAGSLLTETNDNYLISPNLDQNTNKMNRIRSSPSLNILSN